MKGKKQYELITSSLNWVDNNEIVFESLWFGCRGYYISYSSMDPRLYIYELRRPRVSNPTLYLQDNKAIPTLSIIAVFLFTREDHLIMIWNQVKLQQILSNHKQNSSRSKQKVEVYCIIISFIAIELWRIKSSKDLR